MEGQAPSLSALQRGQACILCRRRKTKCDGARPVCGPCSRTTHPEHCEYTEANTRSQTEVLEERIVRLQNRIRELENTAEESETEEVGSILLTRPGDFGRSAQTSAVSMNSGRPGDQRISLTNLQDAGVGQLSGPRGQPIAVFLSRPSQSGFAMNSNRFMQSLQLPINHPGRPKPALIGTIRLWEMLLSGSFNSSSQETRYLSEIVTSIGRELGSVGQPDKRMQFIQAEVLLATYFFGCGRFLEGRYHAAAAMSMAISCQLHKSGSPPSPASGIAGLTLSVDSLKLPEPRDPVELGERIRLFWTVFIVDRCWSVGLGSSVVLPDDHSNLTRITAPWPLNMEDYEAGRVGITPIAGDTLDIFFNSSIPNFNIRSSILEIRAKASAIFEFATRLSGSFDPNLNVEKRNEYLQSFNALKRTIGDFVGSLLPVLNSINSDIDDRRRSFLTSYSLAQISVIQLHNVFAISDPGSYTSCLNAALAVVKVLDWLQAGEIEKLEPFIGVIWLAALRILYREAIAVRSSSSATGGVSSSAKSSAIQGFNRLIAASEELGNKFPFVVEQLVPLKQLWNLNYS